MSEDLFLSVIIPAYNEESNIASTLSEVYKYLQGKDFTYEVIVIDDGSLDGTVPVVREYESRISGLRIIESKPNRGKGFVVKKAIFESRGKYVMFMDADNSTSIYELDKFIPYLKEGYDAVIGSRRLKGSEVTISESPLRIFMGNVYILLSQIMLGAKASDFNCGFKAYKRSSAVKIFSLQRMTGWSFDTELIFLLNKLDMRIKEVPVRWAHKFTSKVKPLKAGLESFKNLLDIKMNDMKGLYEKGASF